MTAKTAKTWPLKKDQGSFSLWLCLPIGMYAISHRWRGSIAEGDPRDIQVRARKRKYLDRLRSGFLPELGKDEGKAGQGTDYGHRAFVSSDDLAKGMARMALAVDASGFKDHTVDNDLHGVYHQMWNAYVRLDDNSPYNPKAGQGWQRTPRPEDCQRLGQYWFQPREGTGTCSDCGARRTKLASGRYRFTYPKGSVRLPVKAA